MSPSERSASEAKSLVTDSELVRRCVEDRDGEAFEQLMSRYHKKVYAVIARLVPDVERARDLTQETFLKAWRALDRFEGAAGFYTWLYRIARNLVSSDFRRTLARPRVAVSLDEVGEDRERVEVADVRGDPGEGTLSRERQAAIVAAIRALIPDFREIIILRDVEKHAYEDIAAMLEIPVGTVRSRLHRARMELKARLADILS